MNIIENNSVICVLTAYGIEQILADGGSQSWVLDAKRARLCEYVVCVQNRGHLNDQGHASAPHHTAFLVGRLKDVVRSKKPGCENRWLLTFSEYAEIDVADAWPGYRNPVLYTNFDNLNLDAKALKFQPMPEQKQDVKSEKRGLLTISDAKEGLALTFGVKPSDIEITVRG